MILSLQPGLNEALYRLLQRKQWERNCEKQRINLEAIIGNSYLCNPNQKDGKWGKKERKGGAKKQVRLKRWWGAIRGKEIITILKFFESLEATALRILSK